MSKYPGNLNRLHSKLLARYGVDDALVLQFKTEIDLKKSQNVKDSRWSLTYEEFIKEALQSARDVAIPNPPALAS
jgi:hypothetical protein